MLKVKSFSIKDDVGINELLTNYRLAEGAHILVTDGYVCIPFEDGEPMTDAQRTIEIKDNINKLVRQIEPMVHSQFVLAELYVELNEKFQTAMADFKSAPNNKKFEVLKKELNDAMVQNESQVRHNDFEIKRIKKNIEVFSKQL